MHLNHKRRTRPDERRQVLKARIRSRFSVLDKTDCDECILRSYRIFNHQIEVAEWTVGWNRIMGGDLRTLHEHEGAHTRTAPCQERTAPSSCALQRCARQTRDRLEHRVHAIATAAAADRCRRCFAARRDSAQSQRIVRLRRQARGYGRRWSLHTREAGHTLARLRPRVEELVPHPSTRAHEINFLLAVPLPTGPAGLRTPAGAVSIRVGPPGATLRGISAPHR